MEGVTGASLCVSVLVPDRKASKSPVTSKWCQCLWTLRTCLGAWVHRWLHWKSRDTLLRQAGLGAYLGQTSPAVELKYEQDTKRPQPNCRAVSWTWSLQTAPPRGWADHPTWPTHPPPPSSHLREPVTWSRSLLGSRGLNKASPEFLIWSLINFYWLWGAQEPKLVTAGPFTPPAPVTTPDHQRVRAGDAVNHQWPNQWSLPKGTATGKALNDGFREPW